MMTFTLAWLCDHVIHLSPDDAAKAQRAEFDATGDFYEIVPIVVPRRIEWEPREIGSVNSRPLPKPKEVDKVPPHLEAGGAQVVQTYALHQSTPEPRLQGQSMTLPYGNVLSHTSTFNSVGELSKTL